MNVEELREHCLAFKGVTENMPWVEPQYSMLATFSIGGKWFCILDMDKKFINVKCDPENVMEMQSRYMGAFPAWHMNKKHWLGVKLESDIPDAVIQNLLANGYKLVFGHLPKKVQNELITNEDEV